MVTYEKYIQGFQEFGMSRKIMQEIFVSFGRIRMQNVWL